jgi:hypothetical protein
MKIKPRELFIVIIITLAVVMSTRIAWAQSPGGDWTNFVNISNTPTASTYPCIVADGQGYVHVLWSENVGGATNNPVFHPDGSQMLDQQGHPINRLTNDGNTLYYTRWDGNDWSDPIDVQVNKNGNLEYPRAIVDPSGMLHVVWVGTDGAVASVMYSRVISSNAYSPEAWSKPIVLVEPTLYAYYPVDIAVDTHGGLHILYSKLGENPGAYIINSSDGGNTWSDPIQIYSTQDLSGVTEGVGPVQLISDQKNRLHATWTRYGSDGNGKAIYYSRSSDLGNTWSRPFEVARWQPGWYETDWLSAGVVGDEVHLIWEGGQIAYQNERISKDGGQTWGENQFILQNLVGENGYANLVVDSADQLHMLIPKRADPNSFAHGVWYTNWDQNHWVDPILLGTRNLLLYERAGKLNAQTLKEITRGTFAGGGLRYQMATILNGNQLFVVVVSERDGELWSSHTTVDAPYIPSKPYRQVSALPDTKIAAPPEATATPMTQTLATVTPTLSFEPVQTAQGIDFQPSDLILFGVLPALVITIGIITYILFFKHS